MASLFPVIPRVRVATLIAGLLIAPWPASGATTRANAVPAGLFSPVIPVDGLDCDSRKVCVANCLGADNRNKKADCEQFCSQCKGD